MSSPKLPLHQRLIGYFYDLLQRFAALSIVTFGFVGPFVLGLLALTLPDITEVGYPEEITVEYMVQMSLSPLPGSGQRGAGHHRTADAAAQGKAGPRRED